MNQAEGLLAASAKTKSFSLAEMLVARVPPSATAASLAASQVMPLATDTRR